MRLTISPEPALLGFLLNGPIHGYDLYKQAHRRLGLVWYIGMSQMYATVKTFERRGWVRIRIRSQGTRPSQKRLELTPAGRQAFDDWLHQPAHGLREFRVDFFLRLYFARNVGASFARSLVDSQIAACQRELERLETPRAEVEIDGDDLPLLIRGFRIQQLTTILRWLESHRTQLIQPPKQSTTSGIGKRPSTRSSSSKQSISTTHPVEARR